MARHAAEECSRAALHINPGSDHIFSSTLEAMRAGNMFSHIFLIGFRALVLGEAGIVTQKAIDMLADVH